MERRSVSADELAGCLAGLVGQEGDILIRLRTASEPDRWFLRTVHDKDAGWFPDFAAALPHGTEIEVFADWESRELQGSLLVTNAELYPRERVNFRLLDAAGVRDEIKSLVARSSPVLVCRMYYGASPDWFLCVEEAEVLALMAPPLGPKFELVPVANVPEDCGVLRAVKV